MIREHHTRVQRTARFYLLGAEDHHVREVWFVLHGYGQLAQRFLRHFTPLDDGSRLVVAPEALNRFYLVVPNKTPAAERPVGATWMTREDREGEIADYVDYLDTLAAEVIDRLPADTRRRARIRVLGFSQGTATAARWVDRGAVDAHELILWGGTLPPEIDLSRGAHALRGVPLTLVAGLSDGFATREVVAEQESRLREHAVPFELRRFDGGHVIDHGALIELAKKPSRRNEQSEQLSLSRTIERSELSPLSSRTSERSE
jgi:predicted esterase